MDFTLLVDLISESIIKPYKQTLSNLKEVFLYIFNYYFKKLSGTGKNYAYCICE